MNRKQAARQADGIDQINQVTQKNADSAAHSSEAAQGLERLLDKLSSMVQKFRLEAAPAQGYKVADL